MVVGTHPARETKERTISYEQKNGDIWKIKVGDK